MAKDSERHTALSPLEQQLLRRLAQGKLDKVIAQEIVDLVIVVEVLIGACEGGVIGPADAVGRGWTERGLRHLMDSQKLRGRRALEKSRGLS